MTRTLLPLTISALAAFALIAAFTTSPAAAQTDVLVVEGTKVGFGCTPTQLLRTCISANSPRSRTDRPTEEVAFYFNRIGDQSGNVLLEKELRVPIGGFQCVDISYAELVAAGLEPDRTTGAVTFRVDILSRVGSKKTRPSGAIMITDAATGKIELYEPIDSADPPDPDADPPGE